MKKIGIVAITPPGAAICYTAICEQASRAVGKHCYPEIIMHAYPFRRYLDAEDWPGVAEIMLASASKLAVAGADFLICPANTNHLALPHILDRSPLPWLHIVESVAAEAVQLGLSRLVILGTKSLMESDLYPTKMSAHGINCIIPKESARNELQRIIYDELVDGIVTSESQNNLSSILDELLTDGADGVVLACTELPLILGASDAPVPMLDSTRILARAALNYALR